NVIGLLFTFSRCGNRHDDLLLDDRRYDAAAVHSLACRERWIAGIFGTFATNDELSPRPNDFAIFLDDPRLASHNDLLMVGLEMGWTNSRVQNPKPLSAVDNFSGQQVFLSAPLATIDGSGRLGADDALGTNQIKEMLLVGRDVICCLAV